MKRFADTFYFMALLNVKDEAHALAGSYSHETYHVVTTQFVLMEVADAMASRQNRKQCMHLFRVLDNDAATTIVPASSALFQKGRELYMHRPDKEWSLPDCISFVIMQEMRITEALTGDHHFEQAGFVALLK